MVPPILPAVPVALPTLETTLGLLSACAAAAVYVWQARRCRPRLKIHSLKAPVWWTTKDRDRHTPDAAREFHFTGRILVENESPHLAQIAGLNSQLYDGRRRVRGDLASEELCALPLGVLPRQSAELSLAGRFELPLEFDVQACTRLRLELLLSDGRRCQTMLRLGPHGQPALLVDGDDEAIAVGGFERRLFPLRVG